MTICAKNLKIPCISLPIRKSARPVVHALFGSNFCILVDVVNIKNSNICNSTANTFTAKRFYNLNFTRPISAFLLKPISLFIPKVFLATRSTKLRFGWFSTVITLSVMSPSTGVVTSHATKFYLASLRFAERNFKGLVTILTNVGNSICFHKYILSHMSLYFKIAERRIKDAQQQMRLPL